ncbi:MAG: redox-sensing transcriptional repressor Rex [Deltaproteobacteria bacterium]|jgi:redox-sensing transcriptional repressor|nr:redox-sensing transcriptional repressor Rex [Deltaproteobacteria bacterium]
MKSGHIPRAAIGRLSVYIQELEGMAREGREVVSSEPLARACEVNASQVRKDLAYFGEFGVRGVGYNVADLLKSISLSLGIHREWRVALVGLGNLGRALLNHPEFRRRNFHMVAAFDCDPFKIGEVVQGLEVICTKRLHEKVRELGIEIGIITTPPERAQRAAQHLIDAGVRALLNYAPARLRTPAGVYVEYVDFFHYLYALSFNLHAKERRT